ncbi:hypothetical protein AMJ85_05060, partial [candidate division BRC1 bacterium SM23_51]
MRTTRTTTVCALLLIAWVIIGVWQLLEHKRAKESARQALVNRARDISYSVGAVIRSQGRFGMVRQPRLEAALEGLAKSNELLSVALLNAEGEVVASAGEPMDLDMNDLPERGDRWEKKTVTFVDLVDLGSEGEQGQTTRPATIILPEEDMERTPDAPRWRPPQPTQQSIERTSESVIVRLEFPPDTPTSGPGSVIRADRDEPRRGPPLPWPTRQSIERTSESVIVLLEFPPDTPTTGPGFTMRAGSDRGEFRRGPRPRGGSRRGPPSPPPFGRPFWMDEERYEGLLQKQGLHGFVLLMSTEAFRAEHTRDWWLRLAIIGIALVAAAGLGLAWRNVEQSAQLQLRLIRASEMNSHLREMNVAAAGLAHETRNPLNIIRGLAQMIGKEASTSTEIRNRSREITEEVDRVTGRLNEFIDYSRPREAKPAPTNLGTVVRDVERTLESDIDDKGIQFALEGPELVVEADESLLRQVLFNLLVNAVQEVDREGKVKVVIEKSTPNEASFEVQDDGPGVPANAREEIFRPYFTTHKGGTGLGLAVVRQIVLAHGWDIEYL